MLSDVTNFFAKVMLHYDVDPHEGESHDKKLLANATLMKALGRTLWKVAEALQRHTKSAVAEGTGPVPKSLDSGRAKVVTDIMKNRLAHIEERYVKHLANAGVFENGNRRPAPIKTYEKKKTRPRVLRLRATKTLLKRIRRFTSTKMAQSIAK